MKLPIDQGSRVEHSTLGDERFQINRLEEEEKNLSRRSQVFGRTPARSLCAVLKKVYLKKRVTLTSSREVLFFLF